PGLAPIPTRLHNYPTSRCADALVLCSGRSHRTPWEESPVQDRLRSAPLFTALDDEAAAAMRASMVEMRLSRGVLLFTEGEVGDKLFLIESGKLKLGHAAPDGRESLIAVLGAGEMLGELSLF